MKAIEITGLSVDVCRITVEHDVVTMYGSHGEPVFTVDRPSYPGAGMGLEVAEHIAYEQRAVT